METLERLHQAVAARGTGEDSRLHQGPHALLQKKGIALRAGDEELLEGRQARVIRQEGLQELVGAGGRQRIKPQLRSWYSGR